MDSAVPSSTTVCVAGGGPAGMMLGFLLARSGIDVVVLEKHRDFLRDFRGDTVHPSTLQIMKELGLLEEFLREPHQEAVQITAKVGPRTFKVVDFSHLKTGCPFIVFMPQWHFLNFLAKQAERYPSFHLGMSCAAKDLIKESGRVVGVRVETPHGPQDIRAALVVAADGRNSDLRARGQFAKKDFGAPIDVLWFSLSRRPDDSDQLFGSFQRGRIFIMINRDTYWQCGFVIPKGKFEEIRQQGIVRFQERLAAAMPFLNGRASEITDWDKVSLLTVRVDRLQQWFKPGLLCIGDAAHAMSPVGGVGINLAIQDAVAAANELVEPLLNGERPNTSHLRAIQSRREWPTKIIQALQVFIQDRVISRTLGKGGEISPPLLLRLSVRFPSLRRIPAYFIGVGFRPEHMETSAKPTKPLKRPSTTRHPAAS